MVKKFAGALAMVFMASTLLAGCSSSNDAENENGNSEVASTKKVEIRISACNSMEHPQTLGLTRFKELVEKQTNGNVTVKIYHNSQLGAERESVEQVANGTLEMATASAGPITTFVKDFSVMDIPFAFNTYTEAWNVLDGPTGMTLSKTLETKKLKNLAWMENGFRHVTNNVREVRTPEDLKNIKIRTMEAPMHMANFTALGATTTPVPWSELYMAMSQKVVDGQENPLANIWEAKMYEVQKYASLTGHIYDAMPLVCNIDWFNELPADYRAVIEKAAIAGQNYSRFINMEREEAYKKLLAQKGMQIAELTNDQKKVFRDKSQAEVVGKIKEQADPKLVDAFLEGIEAVRADVASGLK